MKGVKGFTSENNPNPRKYHPFEMPCPNCGTVFTPDKEQLRALATGRQKRCYCSRECSRQHITVKYAGDKNPNWIGGVVEISGYRSIHKPGHHKVADYVSEHTIVAEEMIGRPLLPDEVVHHIDGNRKNNDPINLRVMTNSEHVSMHMTERHRKRRELKNGIRTA